MKKSNIYIFITCVCIIFVIYLVFPLIAGFFRYEDSRGPKIYNEKYHRILYRIGYSIIHKGKPRFPAYLIGTKRVIFYGVPITKAKRTELHKTIGKHRVPVDDKH